MSDTTDTTVAESRGYTITGASRARDIATQWLDNSAHSDQLELGLPEIDDRYHVWRIAVIGNDRNHTRLGEVVIDANSGEVRSDKSTALEIIDERIERSGESTAVEEERRRTTTGNRSEKPQLSDLSNTIGKGDSEKLLREEFPAESVNLIFTSPPYYNARVEYTTYVDYEEYLSKIRRVIREGYRVLSEGRFFVMNVAPILLRRRKRSESSKRIAVPFDMHRLFVEEGFTFLDDIIWKKPEGAGWATGRGRRFAADRNPLQYKPVPVTEYLLVYRKSTDRLLDWNINNHPDQKAVEDSKIEDGYERTNVWTLPPESDSRHPAVFPVELADRVIKYYSIKNDVVLDPFAGIGTTGKAAYQNDRRFVLVDVNDEYVEIMKEEAAKWMGRKAEEIQTINTQPIDTNLLL